MIKKVLRISALATISAFAVVAFAAPADGLGPWADSYSDVTQGDLKNGGDVAVDRSDPTDALGVAESTGADYDNPVVAGSFFSLGFGGKITLGFDNAIIDGAGNDFQIYEITGGTTYPDELVNIEVSDDGSDWWLAAEGVQRDALVDLEGTPFACIHHVRITDVSNPNIFEPTADGYDLDGAKGLNTDDRDCLAPAIEVIKSSDADPEGVAEGTEVTYTYDVTNVGEVDLDDVIVTDDKCFDPEYVSGDDGDDSILKPGETWVYECSMELDITTTNVVTVTADDPFDDEVTDDDSIEVVVKNPGCTLTQGYWKTHSPDGPAQPDDETWGSLWNTEFDDVDLTWLEVLWTPPKKGDVWFSLAHQYIAAYLNILGGADDTDVADEMIDAANKLSIVTPGAVPKAEKSAWTTLAGALGSYNEGLIGPGHCSETNDEL